MESASQPLNATFHAFKESGKWYASERGYLSTTVFNIFDREARRNQILADNGNRYPGLGGSGAEFIFVIIGDDEIPHGFPLMLYPNGHSNAR